MDASVVTRDLLRGFAPPPELERSRPRDVRLTSAGRALVGVTWLLVAAAIVVALLLRGEARRQAATAVALDTRGVSGEAVVDRVWLKSSDDKPPFVAVHFDAAGTRVARERQMQLAAWRELRVGSRVPVRYLPDDPRTFELAGARNSQLPAWVPYFAGTPLVVFAIVCAVTVRRQRFLLSEGRPGPAVVTAARKRHGSHGRSHHEMTYQFPLLGGGVATGRAQAPGTTAVGATICVVYDPDDPRRSRPYPFSLVAVDVEPRG